MGIYKEVLVRTIMQEQTASLLAEVVHSQGPDKQEQVEMLLDSLVKARCYGVLIQIKAIIEDDSLTSDDCFAKIQAIVYTLEELGIHTNSSR